MNCKQVARHIDDYQSGNLDSLLKEFIDTHLESCPECRKAMETEKSVSRFLKTGDVKPAATSVAEDLLKRLGDIDRETTSDVKTFQDRIMESRMKWLMIAAVLVGIGLIAILVIPFDSRLNESSIGSQTGPGYIWLGEIPLDDPMESRWYDQELVNPYSVKPEQTPLASDEAQAGSRVIHVLEFGSTPDSSGSEREVKP